MRNPSGELLSGQVLEWLRASYPEVQVGRWRDAVLGAFLPNLEGLPEDFTTLVQGLRFEPDAFVVNLAERFVHFFEIEVYNPMTDAKLEAYGKFMRDMDFYGIELCVVVVNKYGHVNTVDLLPYYCQWLQRATPVA